VAGNLLLPNRVRTPSVAQGQLRLAQGSPTQKRGAAIEAGAAAFLTQQGLRIVARNVRWRGGEIDLIAQHGTQVVFIEVRARARSDYGGAAASVTRAKQQKIIRSAQGWLLGQYGQAAWPQIRFDVVLCQPEANATTSQDRFEWLQAAFDAGSW
jgi:putative endonuclease